MSYANSVFPAANGVPSSVRRFAKTLPQHIRRWSDADAARQPGRLGIDRDDKFDGWRHVFFGRTLADEERTERHRDFVGHPGQQSAKADAVKDAFRLFEYPDAHGGGSITALGTPEAQRWAIFLASRQCEFAVR